jgi:poly(3-hydroxybutyrate) depolymerase
VANANQPGPINTSKTIDAPKVHAYTRMTYTDVGGHEILDHWTIHGAGHPWSGGSPAGTYTDPQGPDATSEMLRFFLGAPTNT